MAKQSLKEKTVKGTIWSGIDNVSQYAVSFVVSIVLARLLSPENYGLLGITSIFTAVCNAIINGGFTNALIRKKDVTDDDYNTVFIINLGMSFLLYAVVFICAHLIAGFFGREELTSLVRVTSLGMIIGAFAIVQQTRLTKRIDFKTQTKITLIASICSGIVGILMAVMGFGVWSLVSQSLSAQFLRTVFLWIYNKWVPRLFFSVKSFRDLFGFGWKIMLSSLISTVWGELHQVVVGKFYSPATLGQYSRAKHFSRAFSSNITNVIQRVTFPVLADLQDDKDRMVKAYRRIIKVTMFITTVCMFFLGAVSEPLLYCLIGPKWHEAATYLPLICVVGSLYPLHAINLNMLQVQGRSDLFLVLEIIKKIINIAPLLVGAFIGIIPMLFTSIITGLIAFFLNSFFTGRFLNYGSLEQLKDVAPSYGTAFLLFICVYFFKYLPLTNWLILPLQLIIGSLFFFVFCNIIKLDEYKEVKEMIRPFLNKFRK